ncbi:lysophospholipid acyltransferase family protein [Salinisphaera sp. Q1T1-3]|uniref:LpxL/LpxP family acyltransferase n=1 Tax=Salinisphaera sp. Q1T1-3 TaxID=2321229 RepID=UPI000E760FF3|nr:lysophospholipid acyltransferase family protein [Salinisphaera sp. Q1T1-3]RJS94704.1 lipid A biosynthesis acyltransferase [Salinisphaera sp. Q1T1-3]
MSRVTRGDGTLYMTTPSEHDTESARFYAPRHWPSWALMGLGWLLSQLPYRIQMALGAGLGRLAQRVVPDRARIADINLRLCYPDLSETARADLLAAHFRSVGRGALETGICWWGSQDKIDRLAHVEGLHHLEDAATRGRGIILLSAHTTSLELGVRMAQKTMRELGFDTTAMYKPPRDPVVERVMRTRREAHIGGASIPDDDVMALLAALRRGDAVWYAADQKAGKRVSVTVDFFGQPARTHTAVSRMAKMTRATVVPFFTLRRADGQGYRLIIKPPLADFPSDDEATDARRINAIIEDVVNEDPAQYFWLHQRFKRKGVDPYKPAASKSSAKTSR